MILLFRSKTIIIKVGVIGILVLATICVSITVHARTDLPIQINPQKKTASILYGKNEVLPKPLITVHIEYHGKMKDYTVPQDTVGNTLNRLHIQLGKDDVMGWELSDMITDNQTIVITKIEYKEETREEIIPYKTEKIDADDMLIGESEIVQQGQNGLKRCLYKNTYFNDYPWHRFKKSETIITPAVNEIIKIGTQNILEIQNVDFQNEDSVLLKTRFDDKHFKLPKVRLSEHDRDLLERLLTGEFGGSFTGAALVAQAIKCAIVYDHYTSMDNLIIGMGYVGSTDIGKSQNAVDAAKYVFDENALAVKHRLFYMCTEDYYDSVPGNFHSTQNFILQYENVKFFDRW